MPYSLVYYHIVWGTYLRQPLITTEVEKILFHTIRAKSTELNSPIHALNGTEDHIHVVVSVALSKSISEWVRQVKGGSSFAVNHLLPDRTPKFAWQQSYGVQTFGHKALRTVLAYVRNQKEHHRINKLWNGLEKCGEED